MILTPLYELELGVLDTLMIQGAPKNPVQFAGGMVIVAGRDNVLAEGGRGSAARITDPTTGEVLLEEGEGVGRSALLRNFERLDITSRESEPVSVCNIQLLDRGQEVMPYMEPGRTTIRVSLGFQETRFEEIFLGVLESAQPLERQRLDLTFKNLFGLGGYSAVRVNKVYRNKTAQQIAKDLHDYAVGHGGFGQFVPTLDARPDEMMEVKIRKIRFHNSTVLEAMTRLAEVADYSPPRLISNRVLFAPNQTWGTVGVGRSSTNPPKITSWAETKIAAEEEPILLVGDNVIENSVKFSKLRVSQVRVYSVDSRRKQVKGKWPKKMGSDKEGGVIELFIPELTASQAEHAARTEMKKMLDGRKGGEVKIFGDPRLHAGGTVLYVDPEEPDVSGFYMVREARHVFERGYFTYARIRAVSDIDMALNISEAIKNNKKAMRKVRADEKAAKRALKKAVPGVGTGVMSSVPNRQGSGAEAAREVINLLKDFNNDPAMAPRPFDAVEAVIVGDAQ